MSTAPQETQIAGKHIVVWFSCGAASAVAALKTLELYKDTAGSIRIANNPIAEEDPDNVRFLRDFEQLAGVTVESVTNFKYPSCSIEEVWADRKYMSGIKGAPCTYHLKKVARYQFEMDNDIDYHVLGFTAEEEKRLISFRANERSNTLGVLVEAGITKADCYAEIARLGLTLPLMYRLGYPNANCPGCVKATSATYWNHVRRVHPLVFKQRADTSRRLGVKLARYKGVRVHLDDLPPDAKGCSMKSMNFECGIFCTTDETDLSNTGAKPMSTAPATMKELEAKMITPWVFMAELKSYSDDTRTQVNNWTRQLVNAGTAIRFNQKWPGCKTEAEGKTLILTTSLAEAHHTKKPLRFGALDYTISYIKGAKYGTLYAVHKGEQVSYSEAERKAIFTALHRRATLAEYTQHVGQQTFEYHEQAQQYLVATPLSAKATKAFDDALTTLTAPAAAQEPQPGSRTLPINDPAAQQNINCARCDAPIAPPPELIALLNDPANWFVAFNSGFDEIVIRTWFGIHHPNNWLDSGVAASRVGFSVGKLEDLAKVMKCKHQKIELLPGLMKLFSGAELYGKAKTYRGRALYNKDGSVDLEYYKELRTAYIEYGIADTWTSAEIFVTCMRDYVEPYPITDWLLHQRMNQRGLGVDRVFVNKMIALNAELKEAAKDDLRKLCEITCTACHADPEILCERCGNSGTMYPDYEVASHPGFAKWLAEMIPGWDKGSAGDVILPLAAQREQEFGKDDLIATACRLKAAALGTANAKFTKLLSMTDETDRTYNALRFNGAAQTGRPSGSGFQALNMARPYSPKGTNYPMKKSSDAYKAADMPVTEWIERYGYDAADVAAKIIRAGLIPKAAHKFVDFDFSGIESNAVTCMTQDPGRHADQA